MRGFGGGENPTHSSWHWYLLLTADTGAAQGRVTMAKVTVARHGYAALTCYGIIVSKNRVDNTFKEWKSVFMLI
jgi:hypothetical protein